jgi:hypothetical protein
LMVRTATGPSRTEWSRTASASGGLGNGGAKHTPFEGTRLAGRGRHADSRRKQKPDGSWREYACARASRAGLAVVRFPLPAGAERRDARARGRRVVVRRLLWERRPYTSPAVDAGRAHRAPFRRGNGDPGHAGCRQLLTRHWWVLPGRAGGEGPRRARGAGGRRRNRATRPRGVTEAERAIAAATAHIDEAARIERTFER